MSLGDGVFRLRQTLERRHASHQPAPMLRVIARERGEVELAHGSCMPNKIEESSVEQGDGDQDWHCAPRCHEVNLDVLGPDDRGSAAAQAAQARAGYLDDVSAGLSQSAMSIYTEVSCDRSLRG
jgi:hypothetical protein